VPPHVLLVLVGHRDVVVVPGDVGGETHGRGVRERSLTTAREISSARRIRASPKDPCQPEGSVPARRIRVSPKDPCQPEGSVSARLTTLELRQSHPKCRRKQRT
jgi:hypothetical protein